MLFARGGDNASMDVSIPPKNTGIAPGPMLTDFKENNIPTKIDQGTIWIMKETVPVKKGEPISEKLAGLLTKLDIKAIEAGTSRTAIARYCGLTSTTQIGRTLSIFSNLDERIHDSVVYGAKNNKLADYETITFQTAYEISRFEKEHQKKRLNRD